MFICFLISFSSEAPCMMQQQPQYVERMKVGRRLNTVQLRALFPYTNKYVLPCIYTHTAWKGNFVQYIQHSTFIYNFLSVVQVMPFCVDFLSYKSQQLSDPILSSYLTNTLHYTLSLSTVVYFSPIHQNIDSIKM